MLSFSFPSPNIMVNTLTWFKLKGALLQVCFPKRDCRKYKDSLHVKAEIYAAVKLFYLCSRVNL